MAAVRTKPTSAPLTDYHSRERPSPADAGLGSYVGDGWFCPHCCHLTSKFCCKPHQCPFFTRSAAVEGCVPRPKGRLCRGRSLRFAAIRSLCSDGQYLARAVEVAPPMAPKSRDDRGGGKIQFSPIFLRSIKSYLKTQAKFRTS